MISDPMLKEMREVLRTRPPLSDASIVPASAVLSLVDEVVLLRAQLAEAHAIIADKAAATGAGLIELKVQKASTLVESGSPFRMTWSAEVAGAGDLPPRLQRALQQGDSLALVAIDWKRGD